MSRKRQLRVVYDYQALRLQKYGGISRYFYEIYSLFMERYQDKIHVDISVLFSGNYYFTPYVRCCKRIPKYGLRIMNFLKINVKICFNFFAGQPYDIIHPTYYFPDYLKYIPAFIRRRSKLVITVHDMIYELFYPKDEVMVKRRRDVILAADGIIAVSQKTKEDILRIYPDVPEKKIKVIYHGNSMIKPIWEKKVQFPRQYILMVGHRDFYKNGTIVFRAFKKVKENVEGIKLLCVGGGAFSDEEMEMIRELGIEDSVIQMTLNDDDLYYAYRYASCFIFPSLYEGFGIPILEAFYCECPVILSNASCFPEIAQDGALYFQPDNVDELVEKIHQVVGSREISDQLIEKGKQRLQLFSWEKTAAETYEFYNAVIGGKI